jgi:hypothetical protein
LAKAEAQRRRIELLRHPSSASFYFFWRYLALFGVSDVIPSNLNRRPELNFLLRFLAAMPQYFAAKRRKIRKKTG